MKSALLCAALVLGLVACGPSDDEEGPTFAPDTLQILGVNAPQPLLAGTTIRVNPQSVRGPATLRLRWNEVSVELPMKGSDGARLLFQLDAAAAQALGVGEKRLTVTLSDGVGRSAAWDWPVTIADALPTGAPRVLGRVTDWDRSVRVSGGGFIFPSEGVQDLRLVGQYVTDTGEVHDVDTFFPLEPTEAGSRDQAAFPLLRRLGSEEAGVFAGDAYVTTVLSNGTRTESLRTSTSFEVRPASVIEITPEVVSVGEFLTFSTVGLEPGPGRIATVYLDGRFTDGETVRAVDLALTAGFDNVGRVRLGVPPAFEDDHTVAAWFGARSGAFAGEVLVGVSGAGLPSLVSRPFEAQILFAEADQWVHMVAAPDFDAGLAHFGLTPARADVLAGVQERLERIFSASRVRFSFTRPADVLPDVVTTLTLSGKDVSQRGLRGHDAAPGFDRRNSDMADEVGGRSAIVQQTSLKPGFGGVFLDAYLAYSEQHSGPDGEDVDPLFDQLFGETMRVAATPDEVAGLGAPERLEAIAVAVDALSSLIAEQAAHQLGHALGLPREGGHNAVDAPGCIMDAHGARPFGERAAQPGFAASGFCAAALAELRELLGR